jgi:hypothetical protein
LLFKKPIDFMSYDNDISSWKVDQRRRDDLASDRMEMVGEVVQPSIVRGVVPTDDPLPTLEQGIRVSAGL